jgi:hypothetical protein
VLTLTYEIHTLIVSISVDLWKRMTVWLLLSIRLPSSRPDIVHDRVSLNVLFAPRLI